MMRRPRFVLVGAWLLLAAACGSETRGHDKRLVVLGIDGMDPVLVRQYMAEGRLPNLAKLANEGTFMDLATSNPPQSPVAWSHFITGQDSGGHGIYDFVHRDAKTRLPYLSTSRTEAPSLTVPFLFGWQLPLGSGNVTLLRQGRAFWEVLESHGVPATVVKIPANFPPNDSWRSETLAEMGTPDLLGTPGTFQLLTDDPAMLERAGVDESGVGEAISGGIVIPLKKLGAQRMRAQLVGPGNPFLRSGKSMRVDIDVMIDQKQPVALVRIGGEEVILQPGEWSEWTTVSFSPGAVVGDIGGMVRMHLRSLTPHVQLYVSPINIDPLAPAMPLSSPQDYVVELAQDIGRFYTQGMPEDTKALTADVLSDTEFLAQVHIIFKERAKMLDRELDRYQGGLLFFYVGEIDQASHVFFRTLADEADPELKRLSYVIPELYDDVDQLIGHVRKRVGKDTTLMVMSDHGFAHYRYKVNLNTWLAEHDYLTLDGQGQIDWANTQAYALGLNQLFINLAGRETGGVVASEERDVLAQRIGRELEAWRDPQTGQRVVSRAVLVGPGSFGDRAPDLLVGFSRDYRSSDDSALGVLAKSAIERNTSKWSGDHCMDPALVPGVLFSSRPLPSATTTRGAGLLDFAPTILRFFDIDPTAEMHGRDMFSAKE